MMWKQTEEEEESLLQAGLRFICLFIWRRARVCVWLLVVVVEFKGNHLLMPIRHE
jgi:hypothetical protein